MKRLLLLFCLASCAPQMPVLTPVEVEIPVAVPCRIAPVARPDFAMRHVQENENMAEKVKKALIELHERRAYELELEARISACQ